MEQNERVQSTAVTFAKKNKNKIAKEFTDVNKFSPDTNPISVFMAGSPGAGKTEFSKNVISLIEEDKNHHILRVDGDELRQLLPGYCGDNSYLFQGPISLLVEKIHDFALSQNQSFVLDGTFSKPEKAKHNIERSLRKNRQVYIFYVYQNPLVAWRFTQKREQAEGRNIPKESFIDQFFGAKETIQSICKEFGRRVNVFLVMKDFEKNTVKDVIEISSDNASVDEYLKEQYTKQELHNLL